MFKTIDMSEINSVEDHKCQVSYDYMLAYFDFFTENGTFENARAIVQKYKDFPIEHYKVMFTKIRE